MGLFFNPPPILFFSYTSNFRIVVEPVSNKQVANGISIFLLLITNSNRKLPVQSLNLMTKPIFEY